MNLPRLRTIGEFEVLPTGSAVPAGRGAIAVSTTDLLRSGMLDSPEPPIIGVDGEPAAEGWGSGLIVVPPGRRLLRVEKGGRLSAARVVEVPEGQTVELDYRAAMRWNGTPVGAAVLGPAGHTRAAGHTPAGNCVAAWMRTLSVAIVLVLYGAVFALAVATEPWWLDAVGVLSIAPALFGIGPVTRLLVHLYGRPILRRQADEPRAWTADAVLLPDVVYEGRFPDGYGALRLRLDLRHLRRHPLLVTMETPETPSVWTPPPRVQVDRRDTSLDYGQWWIPLPPGDHRLELTFPTIKNVDIPNPPSLTREFTITAGQARHIRARFEYHVWTARESATSFGLSGNARIKVR